MRWRHLKKRFENHWSISGAKLTLVLSIGVVSLPLPQDSRIDPLSALELVVREGKQKNSTSVTYYDSALFRESANRQRQVLALYGRVLPKNVLRLIFSQYIMLILSALTVRKLFAASATLSCLGYLRKNLSPSPKRANMSMR